MDATSDLGKALTLVVGKKKEKVVVHQLLLHRFGCFLAYCYQEMGIGMDKALYIRMPFADPEVIQAIVYWLYHDSICLPEESVKTKALCESPDGASGLLAKLWIAGYEHCMAEIGNDILDSIMALYTTSGVVPTEIIPLVYNSRSATPRIRKLLVRIMADAMDDKFLDEHKKSLPSEFLAELLREFLADKQIACCNKGNLRNDFCKKFHCHDYGKDFKPCADLKNPMVISVSSDAGTNFDSGPIANLPIVERFPKY